MPNQPPRPPSPLTPDARRPLLNSTHPLFTVLLDDEAQIMTGLRQVIEENYPLFPYRDPDAKHILNDEYIFQDLP